MLIAELDVNAAMSATPSQVDTVIALIRRMKHAFEVPQLLHDSGLASAMRTAPSNFNAAVKNAFLPLRLWYSETEQMREFDDLCRHMTDRHLSKYVSSTRVNSCESFSGFAEAHEDSDCRSDSTSSDDDVVPAAESPKPAPLVGETFRVGDASPPHMRWISLHGPSLTGLMPSS
eukprot:6197294-Pleurochrysis_carterae.AAC.4